MRSRRNVQILLAILLSAAAWGQGGRGRGNQQTGTPPAGTPPAGNQQGAQTGAQPAGNQPGQPGAPGNGAGGGAAANEFYNYNTAESSFSQINYGEPVETHQKITINGGAFAYTTRAGFLALKNATSGQSEAHLFFTAYSKDGVSDASTRPIVFFLGGAPGVSAAWQEFGGLGPKRAKLGASGFDASAPEGVWLENPNTILSQADLVFVNPVGTAFSRPDQPSRGPNFWNTAGDIASLGEFVRTYINRYSRRASPLFLAGEDFGTGRAAGLAGYLHEHQIPVRGLALFSMTMSADAIAGDDQYITLLPSLVMSAWFHKKLAPDLSAMSAEQIAGQARQFASREYLHALYKGDRMTAEERAKVVAGLSRLTGVSKAFVENNNLRIALDRFNAELMRDRQLGISNSDARVTGFVPAPAGGGRGGGRGGFGGGAPPAIDFNIDNLSGEFLSAYETYLRRELTFNGNTDGIYYLTTGGVSAFTAAGADDATLSAAFARNPNLHLFAAVNYFDLNTPFYASEFTLAHLDVSPEVRAHNITVSHYEAGEMTYLDNKELSKLQRDLASFLSGAVSRK
jgi:carboxypeptidase C (cathepsin A)